jgi:hypothetical protein
LADFRRGHDGPAAAVQNELRLEPAFEIDSGVP